MSNRTPPAMAESLLSFFVGPDLKDAVLGDMQEKFEAQNAGAQWYWYQCLRSIPSFIHMHLCSLNRHDLAQSGLLIIMTLASISVWELYVARQFSWTIAKQVLDYSPLSAGNTCRAVYICLYCTFTSGLVLSLMAVMDWKEKSSQRRTTYAFLVGLCTSAPALYLLVFPLTTDGSSSFRVVQLIAVWALLTLTLIWRKRSHTTRTFKQAEIVC